MTPLLPRSRSLPPIAGLLLVATLLGGCGDTLARLSEVGREPAMTTIQNPTQSPAYRPVTMPMPQTVSAKPHANSLWRPGARAFFKDQRASRVGDILTVQISIKDEARIKNETSRSRTNGADASVGAFLGYETSLSRVLPEAINPGSLIDFDSRSTHAGAGSVNRDETIKLDVAAVVTQRLPNGNLVVHGRQEVRVNFEVRQLQIAGVIRPEDITATNTVSHEKIAEARISYGGKGQITDVQQPGYGQQIYDIIWPF